MIYITGDCHGDFDKIFDFCYENHTTLNDYMIILGDSGINFYRHEQCDNIKRYLSQFPIKFFIVHGNHEKRPSLKKYDTSDTIGGYEMTVLKTGDIRGKVMIQPEFPNICFAIDSEMYSMKAANGDDYNVNVLVCGGAYSVDKPWRTSGISWFENEQPDDETKQAIKKIICCDKQVDVMLTHTCPTSMIPTELFLEGIDQNTVDRSTEDFFEEIWGMLKDNLMKWYFGHYHGDKDDGVFIMLYNRIIPFSI